MFQLKKWDTVQKAIFVFNLLFFVALLACSVTFLAINQVWNPHNLPQGAMYTRMAWRQTVTTMGDATALIYKIFHLFILYWFMCKKAFLSLSRVFLYFGGQAAGMLLCTVPFGLMDSTTACIDYLFPLLQMAAFFCVLFVFVICVQAYRKIGARKAFTN